METDPSYDNIHKKYILYWSTQTELQLFYGDGSGSPKRLCWADNYVYHALKRKLTSTTRLCSCANFFNKYPADVIKARPIHQAWINELNFQCAYDTFQWCENENH